MKTIKTKILMPILLLTIISLAVVGTISSVLNYQSTFATLDKTMTETAKISSDRIAHQLKEYVNVALESGSIARLANPNTDISEKKSIIDQRKNSYGLIDGFILDINGINIFDNSDYSKTEYFEESLAGRYHVSEPEVVDSSNVKLSISAPLWENGIPQTKIVGVIVFVTKPEFLNEIVSSIKISEGGSAYILDENGTTIAHIDMDRVLNKENIFEVSKSNTALKPLADIHTKMVNGEEGFNTYTFAGVEKFVAFSQIKNSHDWSIAVNAPINDFMSETYASIIIVVVLLIVSIVVAIIIAFMLASSISKPIQQLRQVAQQVVDGDLNTKITYSSKDELGSLANSMGHMCANITSIIKDMSHFLEELSQGNFAAGSTSQELYVGDYIALLNSLVKIEGQLSYTLSEIDVSSDQVSSGSQQVSSGAQALSQGTTQQASSIEELSATIADVSQHINKNAQIAKLAREKSEKAGGEVVNSNEKMQQMIEAMNDISEKSIQISKIIKKIEDIAFQTNILALNAAVEAERAGGVAGKGFAVVADEVKNLSGKSSLAAKDITALINETVKAVENGTKIADSTANAMLGVVEGTQEVTDLILNISSASQEQALSMSQITTGVDQISSVVQTNSATAEQSAAASEELSSQAAMLKQLISKFKFK